MTGRVERCGGLGLVKGMAVCVVLMACLVLGGQSADAQQGMTVVEQWAEVLNVTPKWLVLQNEQGQQFPVSLDSIRLFAARWPTSLDRLGPLALLEATGVDGGSNGLVTGHVDVYEGAAQRLVVPGVLFISRSGEVTRPIDYLFNEGVYGAPFPGFDQPIQAGAQQGPQLVHIVGPIVSRFPLRIGYQETNAYTVVPPPAGVTLTSVTPGSTGIVRPGDIVYFAAIQATPESLVLDQLVLYKSMPLDQFQP